MDYVELHCHSNFSFLQGANHPEELAERAAGLGYAALALTDINGLYGIVRFNQAARQHGVRPLFGSEIILEDRSTVVLLITNQTGYRNLSQLLASTHLTYPKGEATVSFDLLASHCEGLIALSGSLLESSLQKNDIGSAKRTASKYGELFGRENFYLELVHHNLPQQEVLCGKLASLAQDLTLPMVAANNVHQATPDDRRIQDVLTCIKYHVSLDEAANIFYPNHERYLKPKPYMLRRFAEYPDVLANTLAIADRCTFQLTELQTSLPDCPVPDGKTTHAYLRELTERGAKKRYRSITTEVRRQLEHELGIIEKLGLSGYFLIVWDIARFCREQGILCQGRGSAANSAVCYCLEITAVDPIKLDLLFERFISEARSEPPDIDIDIASDRREEAIQYLYRKYGRDHAAMVCNVICFRRRLAVREVGKTLGFALDEIDRFAKRLDHFSDNSEETTLRARELGFDPNDTRVHLWVELSHKIQGYPRHLGIHCGGMIITKAPLSSVVPIENATMPDRSVIQWDKDDSADMGLVKIDLLGLGMLTLIDIALKLVEQHSGATVDIARLPYDDPRVFDLLCSADTVGVFQVESRAQMNTLPRMKPRCFYDLVVEVAIIRPGPIQGDMVHPYLRRRNGEEPVTYLHPTLEPILKRTLGVPLFQEQGLKVAIKAAGFTPSQAEQLRRSIGHKQSRRRVAALHDLLIEGMRKNGIERFTAENIYLQLSAFADFGFAESHAASFALLVYVSAYLKVYFPLEFYCALLNAQPMGFYTPSTIVYEAGRKGIRLLHVSINESDWDCTIEGRCLRIGLRYVTSLGEAAWEKIEADRLQRRFTTIRDFVFRTNLTKHQLEQLAQVGAFDCFDVPRRQALWEILSLIYQVPGELELVTVDTGSDLLPEMRPIDTLRADIMGLNLSTGRHPVSLFRESLNKKNVLSAQGVQDAPEGKTVFSSGMIVIRQRPLTAKGFVFITLEDETGFTNIVVKPNLAKRFRHEVLYSHALLVKGNIERKDGVVNVIGKQFYPLLIEEDQLRLKSRDFR